MIALDTNVLVYAFRVDAPQHGRAVALLRQLARGRSPWCLPWPCITEFLSVVTRLRMRPAAGAMEAAWQNLDGLLEAPSARVLRPTEGSLEALRLVLLESRARAGAVFDAHIAALCLEHGVREILTADRDFRRFRGLKVTDPFA